MTPVLEAKVNPEGRDPAMIDQENGAFPPAFAAVVEYVAPAVPPGKADVATVRVEAMLIERGRDAVCTGFPLSLTCN